MTTTLQVRNVPDDLSRELKARAASEGKSLSDYLLAELTRIGGRPRRADIYERIEARGRIDLPPLADQLRAEREARP